MARQYLFQCDVCGATEQAANEALPGGWAIVVAAVPNGGERVRTKHLDCCSRACAVDALTNSPHLSLVSDRPRAQLPVAAVHALTTGGDA